MKNFLTYRQLDSLALKLLKLEHNDIPAAVRQYYVNIAVQKAYGRQDGLNDPWYNFTTVLTVGADQEQLNDNQNNGGVITAVDATAKTITRNAGAFVDGSLIFVTIWSAVGVIEAAFSARIVAGGQTAKYHLIAGTDADLSTNACSVLVLRSLSEQSADVSQLYRKDIQKISDNQGPAGIDRPFDEVRDTREFSRIPVLPSMEDSIGYRLRGSTIDFAAGKRAKDKGIVQLEYRGKPPLYTEATIDNEILIPPEENQTVIDEVVVMFGRHAGVEPPADVQERYNNYREKENTEAKDEATKRKRER